MKVTVVGQGYVGLPIAITASQFGYTVYGLDNNDKKVSLLKSGKSVIEDLSDEVVEQCVDSKRYLPTVNQSVISESDVILICVPTPLSNKHLPDLEALTSATAT